MESNGSRRHHWRRGNVVWARMKGNDLVFAEVGPGHPQVLWRPPHPCSQGAARSFRSCSWSNLPCFQVWGSHPSHNQRGARTASAVSLFWQEHSPFHCPTTQAPPDLSSCPRAWDPGCCPHKHHHARQEKTWAAQPCPNPGGLGSTAPCNPSSETTSLLMWARRGHPTATSKTGDQQDMQCACWLGCAQQHRRPGWCVLPVGTARVDPAEVQ